MARLAQPLTDDLEAGVTHALDTRRKYMDIVVPFRREAISSHGLTAASCVGLAQSNTHLVDFPGGERRLHWASIQSAVFHGMGWVNRPVVTDLTLLRVAAAASIASIELPK
jgi:hypothetical protein